MIRKKLQASGSRPQAPGARPQASGIRLQGSDAAVLPCSLQPGAWSLPRRGFTLTELLVVISIIGMLAGMSLGALYAARESARVQKTKGTITKLDRIIQAKYAEFRTRRLPIHNRRIDPKYMAELKLQVLREIIRMEMPDRLTDITYPRSPAFQGKAIGDIDETFNVPPEIIQRTAKARSIFRRVAGNTAFFASGVPDNYSPAECLYLIIASDPEAREQFQPDEIGDVDEDGVSEFLDAWGMPIKFIRWAPAFRSEMQTGDFENDHDPFDTRRVDPTAFRMVPLIYSAGPDKEYGIAHDDSSNPWVFQYGGMPTDGTEVDRLYEHAVAQQIGGPKANASGDFPHHDNITNHSLGMN